MQGPAGVVCCELRGADMQWPRWDKFVVDGTVLDCKIGHLNDFKKHLLKRVRLR